MMPFAIPKNLQKFYHHYPSIHFTHTHSWSKLYVLPVDHRPVSSSPSHTISQISSLIVYVYLNGNEYRAKRKMKSILNNMMQSQRLQTSRYIEYHHSSYIPKLAEQSSPSPHHNTSSRLLHLNRLFQLPLCLLLLIFTTTTFTSRLFLKPFIRRPYRLMTS